MRKHKRPSLKIRSLVILLLTLVPFTAWFMYSSFKTSRKIDRQNADVYIQSLSVFCTGMDTAFSNSSAFLFTKCWSDDAARNVLHETDMTRIELAATETRANASAFLDSNPEFTGIILYHPASDYRSLMLQRNVSYSEAELTELQNRLIDKNILDNYANLGWITTKISDLTYMYRVAKINEAIAVCFINLDRLANISQTVYGLSAPVVFVEKGKPLTQAYWLRQFSGEEIPLIDSDDYYFLKAGGRNHMVVMKNFTTMHAVYALAYSKDISWVYGLLFLAIGFLAFFAIWMFLDFLMFKPLYAMVNIMKGIRSGSWNLRVRELNSSDEFNTIGSTFNEMVDTISTLRIESYERKLSTERAESDALRLQIRPHFFLNCLKAIYGLAQSGNSSDIQAMILLLAPHLRYTLDINTNEIALSKELDMCQSYIELQGIGQKHKHICSVQISDELRDFLVPPVSILSLIENTAKYGVAQDAPLIININAQILTIDHRRIVQLVIQDNGPGFPIPILQSLNLNPEDVAKEGHVGIINVIRRFQLMYGESFSALFTNNNGARIELMMQYNKPLEGDSENEIINS